MNTAPGHYFFDVSVTHRESEVEPNHLADDIGGKYRIGFAAQGRVPSSAPTYFPPYEHPTFGYCIDGGVYANNPGCTAIASALNSGVVLSDIVMLSVGTGAHPENVQVSPPPTNYGSLMWMLPIPYGSTPASPILSIFMDGVASADAFICQQLLGSKFKWLQVPLTSVVPLDDYQDVRSLSAQLGIT